MTVLEFARIERFIAASGYWLGRPPACRAALARAFLAKAVFELPMTVMLRERLLVDKVLRRLCGWERAVQVPRARRRSAGPSPSSPPARCRSGRTRPWSRRGWAAA